MENQSAVNQQVIAKNFTDRAQEFVVPDQPACPIEKEMKAVNPLFNPPMHLNRATLRRWASWDTRFGILPRRPNVNRLFDFALAP